MPPTLTGAPWFNARRYHGETGTPCTTSAAALGQAAARAYLFGEYVVRNRIARLILVVCACATLGACRDDAEEKNA
jgi:hypothetical protein